MAITDPRDIPGLLVWYSAEAETGYANGAAMTQWTDRSGNGNHATAVAGPVWQSSTGPGGGPAVSHGGYFTLPDVFAGAAAGEAWLYIKADAASNNSNAFGSSTSGTHYPLSGLVYEGFGLASSRVSFTPTVDVLAWRRYNIWSAASDWGARLDEVSQHSTSSPPGAVGWRTQPMLGRNPQNNLFTGKHSCVLLYSRKLTTSERADLAAWMAANPSGGTPGVPKVALSGVATATSALAGGLQLHHALAAAAVAVATAAGALTVAGTQPLVGAATATGTTAGTLTVTTPAAALTGTATAFATVFGGLRISGVVVGTARRNLDTSTRRRTGTGWVDITVPVAPEPPTIAGAPIRVVVDTLPAPNVSAGHVAPMVPTVLRDTEWGRVRITVSHQDVTYYRDKPSQVVDYQLLDPYGYGPATLRFPQVTFWELNDFGTGALSWLYKNAPVRIQHVQAGDARELLWLGHIDALDFDDDGALIVDCSGELSGRMDKTVRTQRLVRSVHDAGFMARIALSIQNRTYQLKGSAQDWSRTGIELENLGGGGGTNLAFLDYVLANAVTSDLDSWTILPTEADPRTFDLVKRDRSTVHATVYLGARGVSARLRDDQLEQPTRMFGEGVDPAGRRFRGAEYPNLGPEVVPPYPYTDGRTFGRIGLTDADTDTGDGIRVLEDELLGSGLLRLEERGGEWTRSTTEAVEEVQRRAGLPVTGKVDPATWTAVWGDGDDQQRLTQARIHPLVWRTETEKWLYSPNGSIIGRNPAHDRRVPRIERHVSFGEGVTKARARRWLRREMNRAAVGWRGTITLSSDVLAGEHTFGEPGAAMSRLDLKAGQNIRVKRFGSASGMLMHIASVQVSGLDGDSPQVQLVVDTQFRDAITLVEMLERDKAARRDPARQWLAQHTRSRMPSDSLVGWDYEAGAGVVRSTRLTGNTWNVIKVIGGQAGEIQRIDLTTENSPAAFVTAVFARPVRPGELAQRVGDPFITVGTEEVWQQIPVADWLAGLDPEERRQWRDSTHQREGFVKAEDGSWVPPDYYQGNIVRDADGKWTSVDSPPSGQELADLQAAEANRREERVTAALQTFADTRVGVYVAGTSSQPLGYWPRKKTGDDGNPTGHPITGRWRDDASFSYWTIGPRSPWLYLAVYPDRDCTIHGRLYDQLIEGA